MKLKDWKIPDTKIPPKKRTVSISGYFSDLEVDLLIKEMHTAAMYVAAKRPEVMEVEIGVNDPNDSTKIDIKHSIEEVIDIGEFCKDFVDEMGEV